MSGHSYSSTQINLSPALSRQIRRWSTAHIPRGALYNPQGDNYGREHESHITVKYGLHVDGATKLRRLLKEQEPFRVTLGKTDVFSANDKYDVLIIRVISRVLHNLHWKLTQDMANTETWPSYNPHVTIAYVKKGKADHLKGLSIFNGRGVAVTDILFSPKEGPKESIHLVPKHLQKAAFQGYLSKTAGDEKPSWMDRIGSGVRSMGERFLKTDLGSSMALGAFNRLNPEYQGTVLSRMMKDPKGREYMFNRMKKGSENSGSQFSKVWGGLSPSWKSKLTQQALGYPEGRSLVGQHLRTGITGWYKSNPGLSAILTALPLLLMLFRSGGSAQPKPSWQYREGPRR